MSMFGYGGGSQYDDQLSSKIDQLLSGQKSAKDKVEQFLVEELHVDPAKLPLSLNEARKLLKQRMDERDCERVDVLGNSRGLSRAEYHPADQQSNEPSSCPNCANQYEIEKRSSSVPDEWECMDCGHLFIWVKPAQGVKLITVSGDDPKMKDAWAELERIYAALVKGIHDENDRDFTKFMATKPQGWGVEQADVVPIQDAPPKWKKAAKYPTGTILRVQREDELEYVRVGGIFDDTQVVILATMQPISDVSKWTVTEVLT